MNYVIEGIELIGKQKDAGYKVPFYLVRTPEGKYIQVTELLFQTIAALQQEQSLTKAASVLSKKARKHIDTKALRFLIEKKLAPLGIIKPKKLKTPVDPIARNTPDLMLSIKGKVILFSEGWSRRIAYFFLPLFWPPVVVGVIAAAIYLNFRLFTSHSIPQIADRIAGQPVYLFFILSVIVLSTLFNEFGHAAGCRYGGGKPGKIGVGLYLVWPAFFTDVTDSYRLNRIGRLRSDAGGVYFNLVCAVVLGIVYHFTHFTPLLIAIIFQNVEILHQIMPFLRLDGYFIVSDIVGVPNLYSRMGPLIKSIIARRYTETTSDLKSWVTWVLTFWVVATLPMLVYFLGSLFWNLPEIISSAWASVLEQGGLGIAAVTHGAYFVGLIHMLQLIIYVFPTVGIVVTLYRLARQLLGFVSGKLRLVIPARHRSKSFHKSKQIVIFDRSMAAS